jgi:hypothetical protein
MTALEGQIPMSAGETDQGGHVYSGVTATSSTFRTRLVTLAVVSALALLALLALGSRPASARTLDSSIPSPPSPFAFEGTQAFGFDADDNVWITDAGGGFEGTGGLFKYDAYPSQTRLLTPNVFAAWGFYTRVNEALDVYEPTGEVLIASANSRHVDIFDQNGNLLRTWSRFNDLVKPESFPNDDIKLAIDNGPTESSGRIYVTLADPENNIEAYDIDRRRIDFPSNESYVEDNRIIGTPNGPFGEVRDIAIDEDSGDIYVLDWANGVVDVFASTGVFLRELEVAPPHDARGLALDPTNGNVLTSESSFLEGSGPFLEHPGVYEFDESGNFLGRIDEDLGSETLRLEGALGVNSDGYLYVPGGHPGENNVEIFGPTDGMPSVSYGDVSAPTATGGTVNATIDPNGGGAITTCKFQYGANTSYGLGDLPCSPDPNASPPGSNFASPTPVSAPLTGLTTEATYHYRVVVTNANGTKYGPDREYTPHQNIGLRTDPATSVSESGATFNGSLIGNGEALHYYFEWGPTTAYGQTSETPPGSDGASPGGPARTSFTYPLSGLAPYSTYHYRIVATTTAGTSYGEDQILTTSPGVPSIAKQRVTEVHSDRGVLHAQINPNGAATTYRFEYVDDQNFQQSGFAQATQLTPQEPRVGRSKHVQSVELLVSNFKPGTLYHYRAVATNVAGTGFPLTDSTFRTFRFQAELNDPCANAHVRQQTGTALLLDCRAYELVSAANAEGYDVESSLVAGQTPFGGYPDAGNPSQVLYAIHNGALSTGNPTNRGIDPYVATRDATGWRTEYVGIPANGTPAPAPFSSSLAEADSGLDTFVFGGSGLCSPCFADGSTGAPVHMPDGELLQGMVGSIFQPSAQPAGYVGRRLSADGTHLVFGSTSQFEPDGNSNGDVTIYDRDLRSDTTQVVSTTPAGSTMTGPGIGQLDISADGSRILIGRLVSEAAGDRYWHLYIHIGDSPQTIDLTPGAIDGVLYAGMSADGTKVFFTSGDPLVGSELDESVDLYRADVSISSATISRVSTGIESAGDTDGCDPFANTVFSRWNSRGTAPTCDVLAVGGRGGVASGDGTVYFLSPELLDGTGNGVQDAPNLYLARPGGAPHFVATLESSANAPLPEARHAFLRSIGTLSKPTGVALDQGSGDLYVLDVTSDFGSGFVYKFNSSGQLDTTFGENGKLDGSETPAGGFEDHGPSGSPTTIAVDNAPGSPSQGDLYVPDFLHAVVDKFDPSGEYLGQLTGGFLPTGAAVNPVDGRVYVTTYFGGVRVYSPTGTLITTFSTISSPTSVAVDSGGTVYVANGGGLFGAEGEVAAYTSTGSFIRQVTPNPSLSVGVDPTDDHLYVTDGKKVDEYDSSGAPVGAPIGAGLLSGTIGVTAFEGKVFASSTDAGKVLAFGPLVTPPSPDTDNPLVIDSVSTPDQRHTADFQVTAGGDNAAFTSTLPLTEYGNASHREVFRYDASDDALECASCNPTREEASHDAALPSGGAGVTDDGRVFFNTTEGLVDRDLNNLQDAYQWEPQGIAGCAEEDGCIELISTGASPFSASLLGVSSDGVDAYFFTREKLAREDKNGNSVKIYDARSLGGFPFAPDAVPCKASDECHGPGTPTPAPPNIKSIAGTPRKAKAARCKKGFAKSKKGFAKKKGKCVRKKHRRRHSTRRHG